MQLLLPQTRLAAAVLIVASGTGSQAALEQRKGKKSVGSDCVSVSGEVNEAHEETDAEIIGRRKWR